MKRSTVGTLLGRDGAACRLCGEEFTDVAEPTIDHIWPVSRGGTSQLDNLQLAHALCNNRRGNDDGEAWRLAHPHMAHLLRPWWPELGLPKSAKRRRAPGLTQSPTSHELAALRWERLYLSTPALGDADGIATTA